MTQAFGVDISTRPTDTGEHAFEWDYNNLFLQNRPDINEGITDGDCLVLTSLVSSIKTVRPMKIVEVGSWKGGSASIMAFASHPNGILYCVDTWEGTPDCWNQPVAQKYDIGYIFLRNMALMGLMERVHMVRCDSHRASTLFGEDSVDMVFIDGDHRYDGVKQDIEDWYPKIRSGGIMAGHDLNFDYWDNPDEVDKWLNVDGNECHGGVIKAVYDRFGKEYKVDRTSDSTIWWVTKGG